MSNKISIERTRWLHRRVYSVNVTCLSDPDIVVDIHLREVEVCVAASALSVLSKCESSTLHDIARIIGICCGDFT